MRNQKRKREKIIHKSVAYAVTFFGGFPVSTKCKGPRAFFSKGSPTWLGGTLLMASLSYGKWTTGTGVEYVYERPSTNVDQTFCAYYHYNMFISKPSNQTKPFPARTEHPVEGGPDWGSQRLTTRNSLNQLWTQLKFFWGEFSPNVRLLGQRMSYVYRM